MATRTFQRRPAAELGDPQGRVADLVARHGSVLMRIARQWSLCSEDAQDAYQRALEIYIRRVETLDPTTEAAWLKVVIRHEALAVRRARHESVTPEEIDFDTHVAPAQRSIEDRFESTERVARSAEVMRRLKPDEATALMLKAEGLSYTEIGMRQGWSYTKVNRCITEGRRRFMTLYEQLEAGAECERVNPTLVALAHGNATSEALLDIRPHLRNCTACRATVRKLHASRRKRFAAFFPFPAVIGPVRGWIERVSGRGSTSTPPDSEHLQPLEREQELDEAFRRITSSEAAVQPAIPTAVQHVDRLAQSRINLRGSLESALQRLQSSDLMLGMHATSSGGGRAASIAAMLGVCVSGVGAGTYCVATALLPDPKPIPRTQQKPTAPKSSATRVAQLPDPAGAAASPAPEPRLQVRHQQAVRTTQRVRARPSMAKGTPTSHEQAPVSPAPAGAQDFSIEQSAAPAAAQPAAAPATGGGEFGP